MKNLRSILARSAVKWSLAAVLVAFLTMLPFLALDIPGLLSFGHALYFAIGAYGLGIALRQFGMELLPAMVLVFVVGLVIAAAVVVLGGVGYRWGAVIGGVVYTLLDQRLTAFASSDAVSSLPDILRVPLSQPLFILGTLVILVVLFLPGGLAGVASKLTAPKTATHEARLEERS